MSAEFAPNAHRASQSIVTGARELMLLRDFYLQRLRIIVEKVRHHGGYLVASDRRMVLLNRALLATLCQCTELGVEAEARRLLGPLRREPRAARAQPPFVLAPL